MSLSSKQTDAALGLSYVRKLRRAESNGEEKEKGDLLTEGWFGKLSFPSLGQSRT